MEISRGDSFQFKIEGIEDDMGHKAEMDLMLQHDGDVVVTMRKINDQGLKLPGITMEFCLNGTRDRRMAVLLRTIILTLAEGRVLPG